MVTFLIIVCGLGAFFMFWEFPAFTIFVVVLLIVVASCSDIKIEDTVKAVDEAVSEIVQQKTGTPETPETTETPIIKNSVTRKCLDGIVYLLVIDNGQSFMAPKEDTFGYNVKCSE